MVESCNPKTAEGYGRGAVYDVRLKLNVLLVE